MSDTHAGSCSFLILRRTLVHLLVPTLLFVPVWACGDDSEMSLDAGGETGEDAGHAVVDAGGVLDSFMDVGPSAPDSGLVTADASEPEPDVSLPASGPIRLRMTSGAWHACALTADGTQCWGHDTEGRATPPSDFVFAELQASHSFTCGLSDAGEVRCFGNPPRWEDLPPASAIGARVHQICVAERTDGRVHCVSRGDRGSPPDGLRASQLAADSGQTCAVALDDGRIHCWGNQVRGTPPDDFSATRVVVSATHACALDASGRVECWGSESGDYPPAGIVATDIAVTDHGTCVVTEGRLRCDGTSDRGGKTSGVPDVSVVAVYGNTDVYCGLAEDLRPFCWGLRFGEPENLLDDVPEGLMVLPE